MLDDLKYIHNRDKSDSLGVAEKQVDQLKHDYKVKWPYKTKYKNVIIAGMGGSALAAELVKTWPGVKVPYEIVKNYELPAYVDKDTLVVASSYSGNTEETVTALTSAIKLGCDIAVIASGGELAKIALKHKLPLYQIPEGYQPRMAVFYNFAALVQLLEAAKLSSSKLSELDSAVTWLGQETKNWLPTVPMSKNKAKQIALDCMGRAPVIYAGPKMYPAAYKWKINFNENAKNVAWCNQLPEFNHNEFLGWSSHPNDKPYSVFDLISKYENKRVLKRFGITDKLLSGRRPAAESIEAEGDSLLKNLLWLVMLGDFSSIYLALLNGLDPTPVDLIEKLKHELK